MVWGRYKVKHVALAIDGLIAVVLLWLVPWPASGALVLAQVFVTVAALLVEGSHRRPAGFGGFEPSDGFDGFEGTFQHSPVPLDDDRVHVSDVLLPSSHEDYYFLFSATLVWSETQKAAGGSPVDMRALATGAILRRACAVTARRDPRQASLVGHELAGLLAETQEDEAGRLKVMATSVRLTLPEHDQERLDKLATVRKDEAVWEHERKYEQSRRGYLEKDVLKNPGSAVVWWLSKNDDQVDKAVRDIGLLAQLSSAANNAEIPEAFQQHVSTPMSNGQRPDPSDFDSAADRFDTFLGSMDFGGDGDSRDLFISRMIRLASLHGQRDVADELAERYGMEAEERSAQETPAPEAEQEAEADSGMGSEAEEEPRPEPEDGGEEPGSRPG
ncbi:hypothetical protein [Spirillospora sp. NPDC047279]|uniref:hypothetical protein n=1 Tax=Spirillospora sp. NPDC047279 TaxID=3155478 RepID=UPI00340B98CB